MDQALKARLIGAAVLVALAVLLIPEMLSGRKPAGSDDTTAAAARGTRTFTIELAGSAPAPASSPARAPLPAGAPDQAAPVPSGSDRGSVPPTLAADAAAATQPASTTAPPPAASAPPPASTPKPAATMTPARGGWAVQVGAFGTAAAAQKLVDQLQSAGYRVYVSPVSRSGKALHRVRVGPEAERARAEGLAASLKARGLPATVVAND